MSLRFFIANSIAQARLLHFNASQRRRAGFPQPRRPNKSTPAERRIVALSFGAAHDSRCMFAWSITPSPLSASVSPHGEVMLIYFFVNDTIT